MATQPTTGIGSVEETNRLLQEASRQTGIQAPTFSPTGAITSSVLSENEPSIQLPDITPSTISGRIDGQSTALLEFDALEQKAAQKVEEDRVKLQESQTKSASFLEQLGIKKKEVTGQVEEEFGLAGLKELKKTALQGLRKAQVSELGEIERLQTQNLTAVGAQAAEAGIRRKYGFEQLESQLSYYMATDNVTSVEATLNDRLTLELEPLYQQLEMQKGVSEQIYDQLTTSEKRVWDLAISKTENSIQERKDIATYRNGIITTAMQNGVPLPSYVVQELNRAGSVEEVNQILSKNGISLAKPKTRTEFAITPEDTRILVGAGFTPSESDDITRAIRDFGIDAVLQTVDSEVKKQAIRKVFSVQQTVTRAQIDTQVDLSMRQGNIDVASIIKSNLTDEQIKEKAKAAGFSSFFIGRVREEDIDEFLESEDGKKLAKQLYADLLEEQYRAAGIFQ